MELLGLFLSTAGQTVLDVLPIVAILVGFQVLVIRQIPSDLKRSIVGLVYVVLGLALFLVGLEQGLFPLGETMAEQLTRGKVIAMNNVETDGANSLVNWRDFLWVYLFAAAVGFSTTLAEPALIAVSIKAEQISGGAITAWGLRLAVAVGVAVGVALGAYRIVIGVPLPYFIIFAYAVVAIQTLRSARPIIPLAYDSGGVTTGTVTVPVVAALGLGLASAIPGRSPLIDGFGLIAFASVFSIISVLGYAMLTSALKRGKNTAEEEKT